MMINDDNDDNDNDDDNDDSIIPVNYKKLILNKLNLTNFAAQHQHQSYKIQLYLKSILHPN